MIKATAKYIFTKKGKAYEYKLKLPDHPTAHDISLAIAAAVMKERNRARTRMGKFAPMYALTMKLFDLDQVTLNGEFLAQTARIVLPRGNPDPRKDAYMLANQRNEETKPVIMDCDNCGGAGKIYPDYDSIDADYFNTDICPVCKGEGFIIWRLTNRVGRSFSNRLVIDIDGHDEHNMKSIKLYAEILFNYQFQVAKTGNGYWLCGTKEYDIIDDWLYDNCKLLKPDLERKNLKSYIKKLVDLDESTKKIIGGKEALTKKIKESSLYSGFGEFDVIFTLISIKVKKHTIRDSQKVKNDTIEILGVNANEK